MKYLWCLVFVLLINSVASAENDSATKSVIVDNISCEYVDCGCYFSIVSQSLKNADHNEEAEKYDTLSDTAFSHALTFAKEGKSDEMAQKVTLSRIEFGLKIMTKEIDNDASNVSILANKYALPCKELMENPDAIWTKWADKILKKQPQ